MDDLDRYLYLAFVVASVCALLRVAQRCWCLSFLSPEPPDGEAETPDVAVAHLVTRGRDPAPPETRAPRPASADRRRPVRLTR